MAWKMCCAGVIGNKRPLASQPGILRTLSCVNYGIMFFIFTRGKPRMKFCDPRSQYEWLTCLQSEFSVELRSFPGQAVSAMSISLFSRTLQAPSQA